MEENTENQPEEEEADLQDRKIKNYQSDLGYTSQTVTTLPGIKTQSGFEFETVDVAYMTLGELTPEKDNVVLICHALSGTAHVAGLDKETGRPGWWDYHVGPGKTIDTDRFFVISFNILGGCNGSTGPSSIDPRTGKPFGVNFPLITVRDMVRVQKRLLEHLGIESIFAVVGGSMGGMQAQVWAVDYPEMVRNCVCIASCMAQSPMQIAFSEVGRQAILTDPGWRGGDYYEGETTAEHGLAVARMIAHVTYLSEYSMRKKFGRKVQEPQPAESEVPFPQFSVESYLQYQGESFVKRFDPNTYLYLTKAMNIFDLLDGKSADQVLKETQARFMVISFESDWLYPPSQSREMVRALKRARKIVTYANLSTPYGHDSFLIKNPEFTRILGNFMAVEYRNLRGSTDDVALSH